MYPFITIGDIRIYVFGLFLVCAWILFFSCLHFFSQKKGISKPIFSDNIMSFTLAIFFSSRLFDMLTQWREYKFIFQDFLSGETSFLHLIYEFFISTNNDMYGLSLAGGIIGFLILFLYKTQKQKNLRARYLDVIMPSFLIAAVVGYIGAFLGGQVYGAPSEWFFAIEYTTKFRNIPFNGPVFPLAFFYILIIIVLLVIYSKYLNKKSLPDGYAGYILLGVFGIALFIWDLFSGSPDIFEIFIRINQLVGILCIIIASVWLAKFLRS